jgi:hypothetical protein
VVMSSPQITYAPRDDTSTAAEAAALANLYAFVIRSSQAKRKAGDPLAGKDDAREINNACTANEKYTQT